jgi:hypothetical protein
MIQAIADDSADDSKKSWSSEPRSSPEPEEGRRLIRAFLEIGDPSLREAIVEFITDLAKLDEAKKSPR